MKKILGGLLALLVGITPLTRVFAAAGSSDIDELENQYQEDIEVTLSEVDNTKNYNLNLKWTNFEYEYRLISSVEDSMSYDWIPSSEENGNIYVDNFSNVKLKLDLSWNSTIDGISARFIHEKYTGENYCAYVSSPNSDLIDYDEDGSILYSPYFSDETCETAITTFDPQNDYYIVESIYDIVTFDETSFVLNGRGPIGGDDPYEHKWDMALLGDVDPSKLTDGMTLGTLTITISDVE